MKVAAGLDCRGVPISTASNTCLNAYEDALTAFNTYCGDPALIIDKVLTDHPDFVMGHILRCHVHASLWQRSAIPEVRARLNVLNDYTHISNERERCHIAALWNWTVGNWKGMRSHLTKILSDYPRDLLALQVCHLLDFFHGDRKNLRDRIAYALSSWSKNDNGISFIHGMYAFGLEECGEYRSSEENGRKALEIRSDNCWARHAVAHVMEMECRQQEGIEFMRESEKSWSQHNNIFSHHNWWHTALFLIDQGQMTEVLNIYDAAIAPDLDSKQFLLADAVSLLWRLYLIGEDVGNRWEIIADAYENSGEAGFYAFNDMHAMLAYTVCGRESAIQNLIYDVQKVVQESSSNALMERLVGLPAIEAIASFGQGDYAQCSKLVFSLLNHAHVFGGSHAQRDLLNLTLIEAAIRDQNKKMVSILLRERRKTRPSCPFSLKIEERAQIV